MNLILTTGCNKGCSFCFASQNRQEYGINTMDIDTFNILLDKIEQEEKPHIKLLGGEPTIHPNFIEFLDEIEKRKIPTTIISNFLFSDKVKNRLIEFIKNTSVEFLVNAAEVNENIITKWSNNYNDIYKYMYQFDLEEKMTCGYTIDGNKDWKHYIRYTDYLLQHIYKIENLRLSLSFPDKNKNNFYFINNKNLGEVFLTLTSKALEIGAVPNIDCIIYPCMFDNKEEFKYIKKFNKNFATKCRGIPFDIFPNQEAIYCYPLEKNLKIDTSNFNTLQEPIKKLENKYNKIRKNVVAPDECKNCRFFGKICDGPCLGFFNLEEFND